MDPSVVAIVLAAGLSRRMGTSKIHLPWGNSTVLRHILDVILVAGVKNIVLVKNQNSILEFPDKEINIISNTATEDEDMLGSLQSGLRFLTTNQFHLPRLAALIVLGDMPLISEDVIDQVIEGWRISSSGIVVPSYKMRRGHPWLLDFKYFDEILALSQPKNLRDFLNNHSEEIFYVNVASSGILADLDTPADYANLKPMISENEKSNKNSSKLI